MAQTRNQKTWLVVLGLALAACVSAPLTACEDDGVTADCPAMPILSFGGDGTPGEPIGKTEWDNPELPGGGGAMNRWRYAAVKQGCATELAGGASGK